jgi:hypothetical protein
MPSACELGERTSIMTSQCAWRFRPRLTVGSLLILIALVALVLNYWRPISEREAIGLASAHLARMFPGTKFRVLRASATSVRSSRTWHVEFVIGAQGRVPPRYGAVEVDPRGHCSVLFVIDDWLIK